MIIKRAEKQKTVRSILKKLNVKINNEDVIDVQLYEALLKSKSNTVEVFRVNDMYLSIDITISQASTEFNLYLLYNNTAKIADFFIRSIDYSRDPVDGYYLFAEKIIRLKVRESNHADLCTKTYEYTKIEGM